MTRWKLTIEYDGTDFCGWQFQDDVPTIQAIIENAIKAFSQQDTRLHVAGRTDAGVHACGQVAHADFETSRPMTGHEVKKAINAHLRPHRICILKAEPMTDEFHARFSATNKMYRYRIINRTAFLTFDTNRAWYVKTVLDVPAMQDAATLLLGQHDFSTFRDSECQASSPIKTLDRLDVTAHDYDRMGGREIQFDVESKSFLHHQVRNMVGTLSMVGQGKWSRDDLKTALEAKDRTKGGPTAPGAGLYLMRVDY
jgi:tRNA pseudouridine38-40 synthase